MKAMVNEIIKKHEKGEYSYAECLIRIIVACGQVLEKENKFQEGRLKIYDDVMKGKKDG